MPLVFGWAFYPFPLVTSTDYTRNHLVISSRPNTAYSSLVRTVHGHVRLKSEWAWTSPSHVAFAKFTVKAKKVLEKGESEKLGPLLNANFDQRASIMKISKANRKMVEIARSLGASAKFTGSGGAIMGTYLNEDMYTQLVEKLGKKGIEVLKPQIISYKTHKI